MPGQVQEKETVRKEKGYGPISVMLIVFCCVTVNFFGKHLAETMQLPLWLDCLGTVFAAYVLGPVSGALVGFSCNFIYSFWSLNSLVYGITSIFVGVITGIAARRKSFETLFGTTTLAVMLTTGSVLISTVFNIILYKGNTGNVWGDAVKDYLTERGVPFILSCVTGELYLDFLDKIVTVMALYILIKAGRKLRARIGNRRGAVLRILLMILAAALIAVPSAAYALTTDQSSYVQQVYSSDNGLPCGHANDVVQTNDGVLWVGTNSGLYRYNGSGFRYMNSYENIRNVNCLYVDMEGRLWIGTADSGLVISINEKLANTLDSGSGLPSDNVRSIVQSSDGYYYVGTKGDLAVVRISKGIAVENTVSEVKEVQFLSADKDGHVAAVTAEGRLFILKDRKMLYEIAVPNGSTAFSACSFADSGVLYAGTAEGRVISYSLRRHRADATYGVWCWDAGKINRIFFNEGNTWVLSDTGVGIINANMYQRIDTGEFGDSVVRMAADYQGSLWFASSKQGLMQLSAGSFANLHLKYGLSVEAVNSTCVRNGTLYIGTDSGLTAVRLSSGRIIENEVTELLAGVPISCIITDSEGDIWICSGGKGLIKFSPDGNLRIFSGIEYGAGSEVSVCAELSDGNIAVGGESGLILIRNDGTVSMPYKGTEGAKILSICELWDKSILLGTDGKGILVFKGSSVTGSITKNDGLSSDVVRRIVRDGEDGNLFIVTGNGLCYMKDGAVSPLGNFPYSDSYDLVPDDDGELFVLGSAGIYVVNKEELLSGGKYSYILLDHKFGLKGALTHICCNALTEDKNLYLSTDSGVVVVNLDNYRSEKHSYRLRVHDIKLDGKEVPVSKETDLIIGRDVHSIEIVPEVVSYMPEALDVSYYLEGVDSDWKTIPQSELAGVVYTNVPGGDYTFHIAVINASSGAVHVENTYSFSKEKAFYDNEWFIVYLLTVGGLFIGWLAWFITKYRAQRVLAAQQEKLALALKQVQMGNETIMAIARTVDAKDSLTSKHSQRVSEYSVQIAAKYGFTGDEQENLRKAALLHDIGKIGIPDSVLNKPARLTDSEYALMKTHVTRGAEILKDFTLIEHVVDGARYHHERYDGGGYPDGLKGEEIPLYGRIIAIADAFDAMTANRVYRKRLDFSYVLSELKKGSGTQFDPVLLDIFLGLIDSGEIDAESLYSAPAEGNGEEKADG